MKKPDSPVSTIEFLPGGGEMGASIRQKDWSKTPLGSAEFWPQSLRTAVSIMLENQFPMYIAWGKELIQLYNDGYRQVLGSGKHPALAISAKETFEATWHTTGPIFENVMGGKAVGITHFLLPVNRRSYIEECYFVFSYSPVRDESGSVGGVLVTATETSIHVIERRRLKTLRYMAKRASEVKTVKEAWQKILITIDLNDFDIPFALCYKLDGRGELANLTGNINLSGHDQIPQKFSVADKGRDWISRRSILDQRAELLPHFSKHFPELVCGAWPEAIKAAYQVPLSCPGRKHPYGVLILGVNPRKEFDDNYKTFFDLFTGHASTALANAYVAEEEKKVAEALLKADELKAILYSRRHMEQQLTNLFLRAPVAVSILRGPQYIVEVANERMLEIWKKKEEEVLNKAVFEAMPEIRRQDFEELLHGVYSTGKRFVAQELPLFITRYGKETSVYVKFVYEALREEDGKISGIMVLADEVTELVKSRKKIEESEARQKLAIEAAELGTFEMNLVTDELIHNERMPPIFGLEPETAQNLTTALIRNSVHPDDQHIRSKATQEAWKTGHLAYEARVIWPNGTIRWIKTKASVSFDEHHFPLRIYGAVMDITERKMLEQQKDDFMGIVSHELKTPVSSMKGYVQMLEEEFIRKGHSEAAHHLKKVDTQIDKLSNLINDLLDVTKIESGKMEFFQEEFDFDELVDEVVDSMQFISFRHHLRRTGECNKKVNGDRGRIEQVIINFISNAMKYSPKATEVIIDTSYKNGWITLGVQDFGTGVSKSDLSKVFDRFYRARNRNYKSGGLGLGLYISAEIIKRQGGKIWAESEPGKGSVFYFSLNA